MNFESCLYVSFSAGCLLFRSPCSRGMHSLFLGLFSRLCVSFMCVVKAISLSLSPSVAWPLFYYIIFNLFNNLFTCSSHPTSLLSISFYLFLVTCVSHSFPSVLNLSLTHWHTTVISLSHRVNLLAVNMVVAPVVMSRGFKTYPSSCRVHEARPF